MPRIAVHDECLWLRHIDDELFRSALNSLHEGSRIDLLVESEIICFERMAQGKNQTPTAGFKPVGDNRHMWRDRYVQSRGVMVSIEFAG